MHRYFLAGLVLAGAVLADEPVSAAVALLPDYSVFQAASVQGSGFRTSLAFGPLDASTANGLAKTEAGTAPAPFVSATAVSLNDNIGVGARAELSYFGIVTGGSFGDVVGLEISAILGGSAFDGGFRSTLDVTDLTSSQNILHSETCHNLGPLGICTADVGTVRLDRFSFSAKAGHLLLIAISAQVVGDPVAGGGGDAFVDPFIGVSSAHASTYGIEFSPGITQSLASGVPEPATWAMMLIGFAGLGFAARRRKLAGA